MWKKNSKEETLWSTNQTVFFPRKGIDQAHEQNNTLVKGDRGAVELTEHPSALL